MRVFGNVLLVASLAGLGVSIWIAPTLRGEAQRAAEAGLVIEDPLERGRKGDTEQALGLALGGFEQVLADEPENAEAILGSLRAGARLSATTIGRPGIGERIAKAIAPYALHHERVDPQGDALEEAMQEYIRLRLENKWYLVRGTTGTFLAGRGMERGNQEVRSLMSQGPYWREYFPAVLRYLPGWEGAEPIVRQYLEGSDLAGRAVAGMALMVYRRLYGVGDELWTLHRAAIGEAILRTRNSMLPDANDYLPDHPGGLTLLALALYDTPTSDRIVEKMTPAEHPYLPRVVALAKLWAGFGDFSAIDFGDPRYSTWNDPERTFYYMGALFRYAELVRAGKNARANELLEGTIADALVGPSDTVRVMARRILAAVHPERSVAYHRELYEAGGIQRVFGYFGIPDGDRIQALLPALMAPDPAISTLAAVGLLRGDNPSPIQLPTPKE
ncbi:MAG: hypothetical protein ACYTHK_14880 [Planctomycetota bacterium]|jgi:hypothetical protein